MDAAIFIPGRQHVRQARRDRNGPSLGTHHTPLIEVQALLVPQGSHVTSAL